MESRVAAIVAIVFAGLTYLVLPQKSVRWLEPTLSMRRLDARRRTDHPDPTVTATTSRLRLSAARWSSPETCANPSVFRLSTAYPEDLPKEAHSRLGEASTSTTAAKRTSESTVNTTLTDLALRSS